MSLGQHDTISVAGPKRAQDPEVKREVIEFVKMVVWFLLLFYVLRGWVIEGYEVQGPSMEPTLQNGERILVFKLPQSLSRTWLVGDFIDGTSPGNIVVFTSPDDSSKRYVKRVVAKGPRGNGTKTVGAEGQEGGPAINEGVPVSVEEGALFVNNRRVVEMYLPEGASPLVGSAHGALLGDGEHYMLGDNRLQSKDSRVFGPIQDDKIIGIAVLRFWPLRKISVLR